MKHFLIILTVLSIISCSKDDEITKSKGTKLISIAYFDKYNNWEENYFYDSNNKIYKIEDHRAGGRRYEMEYANGKLKQYTAYRIDDNEKILRDSIVYNLDGDIEKTYHFSINSGENLPLARIYKFEYDDSGKLAKKYIKRAEKYEEHRRYYWKGENIERIEHLNGAGRVYWEFFFTYDDKVNYARNIPIYISSPTSENNVISSSAKDYVGNLDPMCNPCNSSYTYNADNLPVRIAKDIRNTRMELRYELPARDTEK